MLKFAAVSLCFFAIVENSPAQSATSNATPETGVALTKLSPPVYPPLAWQAGITGDVKIQIEIRQDGSVASAEVISGHPMLKQAALDSAQKSTFECQGCSDPATAYLLTFTFQLPATETRPMPGCCTEGTQAAADFKRRSGPQVTQSRNHITITAGPMCMCPDSCPGPVKKRSAICLFLWKCSVHRFHCM